MTPNYWVGVFKGFCFLLIFLSGNIEKVFSQQNRSENINVSEFMITKRRRAERFADSISVSERLFFSAGVGASTLFNTVNGNVWGPKTSLHVGTWITPVIGLRGGLNYGYWNYTDKRSHSLGVTADYLLNLSAFAFRHDESRFFELLGIVGTEYQYVFSKGEKENSQTFDFHCGVQAKFNVSPDFNLFIEPQVSVYPDRIDGHLSWRGYHVGMYFMAGVTYKPAGYSQSVILKNAFTSLSVGIGNPENIYLDTEFSIGKWLDPISGIRISVGTSSSYLDGSSSSQKRELNVSLNTDYLCDLTQLLSGTKSDYLVSILMTPGLGVYFPGKDIKAPVYMTGRLGVQANLSLSEHCDLWVEPKLNIFQDKRTFIDHRKVLRANVLCAIGWSYNF